MSYSIDSSLQTFTTDNNEWNVWKRWFYKTISSAVFVEMGHITLNPGSVSEEPLWQWLSLNQYSDGQHDNSFKNCNSVYSHYSPHSAHHPIWHASSWTLPFCSSRNSQSSELPSGCNPLWPWWPPPSEHGRTGHDSSACASSTHLCASPTSQVSNHSLSTKATIRIRSKSHLWVCPVIPTATARLA